MGVSIIYNNRGGSSGLTASEVQALIDASTIQSHKLAAEPTTGFAVGDKYFNTTEQKEYILTSTGFKPIETGEDSLTSEW